MYVIMDSLMKKNILWAAAIVIIIAGAVFVLPRMREAIETRKASGGAWVEAALVSKDCEILEKKKPYHN